jgi:ABC-2 type transport system ATP-binding protein
MGISIGNHKSRRNVGFLPENPAFYDYLNAEEYMHFVGGAFGMDRTRLRLQSEEVLRRLDLWDARRRVIRSYSKGMVQRLGIAQVLLHDPDLYLLDEPMSGLDPVGRALVKQIIVELKQKGKSVFFSTHITSDVEEVCDRVGIIVDGELKRIAKVESILTEGIEGYVLRYRKQGSKEENRQFAAVCDLTATLTSIHDRGDEVFLVEPLRKGLEDFFLAIIKKG